MILLTAFFCRRPACASVPLRVRALVLVFWPRNRQAPAMDVGRGARGVATDLLEALMFCEALAPQIRPRRSRPESIRSRSWDDLVLGSGREPSVGLDPVFASSSLDVDRPMP